MDAENIAERLFDANVRLEKMFWVPGICTAPPNDFDEFVEDELVEDGAKGILEALPFLTAMVGDGAKGEDIIAEMSFRRRNGFFFQVATPTPRDIKKDGSYSFSWGNYRTKWMYADTLEELADMAVSWAKQKIADAKTKAAVGCRRSRSIRKNSPEQYGDHKRHE